MKHTSTVHRRPRKKRPLQWMRILLIAALLVAGISLIMARGASAHSSASVSSVTVVVSQAKPPTPAPKKSPAAKPKAAPKGPKATAKPKAAPKAKPTPKPKAA